VSFRRTYDADLRSSRGINSVARGSVLVFLVPATASAEQKVSFCSTAEYIAVADKQDAITKIAVVPLAESSPEVATQTVLRAIDELWCDDEMTSRHDRSTSLR